ncbi:winged helix-turn-helix domain-containing protein [Rhodococcus rhodochrous]|uniref:Winged helix-turn-helix domain-containing protein n=1 Tax=Rhodococcus rhodochrous TaxID=1829 RepID=A0AAW4XPY9_RHORH|nr:winged helix-turn-helix domain-containing protein [Rhodococcus rhodochrous]MCD2115083.1 winged helix-turn-helix domain-containing protein [Rhodococcus rhodochrous]
MDLEALTVDAFNQLGIDTRRVDAADHGSNLVVDPAGLALPIRMTWRSLVTDDVAERLLADAPYSDVPLLVIANRVTETARTLLTQRGSGYLDLRGRLALRTDRVLIDAPIEPLTERAGRSTALAGRAGLEVATALLLRPEHPVAVRELAREIGRSPSTVSDILAALRRDGLIDTHNTVSGTELFWNVAEYWPTKRAHLASLPAPGDASVIRPLRLGLDTAGVEPGWALSDSAAASAYGAPVAFRSDQILDFFVPDQSILRRATTLLGTAPSNRHARATVRVAPVPAAVQNRIDTDTNPFEWPLAHPLFVALDLAQDTGRGREILDIWTPDERWTRVW